MPLEPPLIAALVGAAVAYAALLRRAGPGSRLASAAIWRFGAALATLTVALSLPMEHAAERSLAAHMVQHQLLVLVAGPLLATSGAARLVRTVAGRALPSAPSSSSARAVAATGAAVLHLAVLLLWHVPAAYDAALTDPTIHQLEHVTMLGTAVLAWVALLTAAADERAVFGAVVGLALLAIGGAALGVVLLTAPVALYEWYGAAAGLDQQRVAGALMKVGALVVHAGGAIAVAARWFRRLDAAQPSGGVVSRS